MEGLEGSASTSCSSLRPIPLLELQAAIEANAPPSPPPLHDDSPPRDPPPACSTPLPSDGMPPPPPPPPKKTRKRKGDDDDDDRFAGGKVRLVVDAELRERLSTRLEFGVEAAWVRRVVASRVAQVLQLRRGLRAQERLARFRGFEVARLDTSGTPAHTYTLAYSANVDELMRTRRRHFSFLGFLQFFFDFLNSLTGILRIFTVGVFTFRHS